MTTPADPPQVDPLQMQEWIEALRDLLRLNGVAAARALLAGLVSEAERAGVRLPFTLGSPYINTIPASQQPAYPGDRAIESRIESLVRWNAMAMVVRGNRGYERLGGHISTFASAATLYEVAFNQFFRASKEGTDGDLVLFQAQSAPGIYSRAYLEGRISVESLERYRRELEVGGLPAYPHPRAMPQFWQFPTASLGLGALMGIYQARFARYLHDRGILDTSGRDVWVFLGDGETDEPETLAATTLAARERLDNLIFVVNCNLQRLDGPVRGNGKIIQELEASFHGAGWNVIKVIWGSDWDPLLEADTSGLLRRRMNETVDGEFQKYTAEPGQYIREHFFGRYPELAKLVENLSDEQLETMRRGGHDPEKVYAAYRAAVEHQGQPSVILAKTIKGYGLGEAGEGHNVTHQQKKLNEGELRYFRDRFDIPISDDDLPDAPFYRPPEDSEEVEYLKERRAALGGFVPARRATFGPFEMRRRSGFAELHGGFEREVSTTMTLVRLLTLIGKDPEIGQRLVPIVADTARTFGMESMFRNFGIYESAGQLYDPVDADRLLYYKESRDGQILQEGVNGAGAFASWLAAATSSSSYGVPMIPFYLFYSMFGFQRLGDLIWAAADMRARGFLVGAVAGRTTPSGEGLQHQDGHSHLIASAVPSCIAYDPAYAYELAVIVDEGLRRMSSAGEDVFYYLTTYDESYAMPAMPEDSRPGIINGMYLLRPPGNSWTPCVQLLGSGPILGEALAAQDLLDGLGVSAAVWSVTSYTELRRDGLQAERWNRLHPEEQPRVPYVTRLLAPTEGPVVASSDYVKAVPDLIRSFVPRPFVTLGTDGYGRSDTRERLRRHFEIDRHHIVLAAVKALADDGRMSTADVGVVIRRLRLDPDGPDPCDL